MENYNSASKINWLNSVFLISTPILAIAGVIVHWNYFGNPGWLELLTFFSLYYCCGLSITVGYHRLFSHRSHEAKWPMILFYSIFGAGCFQNSILEWCSDHRAHHKNTDSTDDPYSAARGFWYSHIGWVMVDDEKFENNFSNVADLTKSKIIMWQHRNIFTIGAISGIFLPMLIGLYFGGFSGAFGCLVWAGLVRVVFVHHGTFLINSAAHIWGKQPYSEQDSSRDSFWLAFLTFGEGYHNFHHTFQADYRNGHRWFHIDPSKWWIKTFNLLGLKSNLKKTPKHSIEVAKIDTKFSKEIEELRTREYDTISFEVRMKKSRDALRSCLFEIQSSRRKMRTSIKSAREKLKLIIEELKKKLASIRSDLKDLFYEMQILHKNPV